MNKKPTFNPSFSSSEKRPRVVQGVSSPQPRYRNELGNYDKEHLVWKVGSIDYDFEFGWLHIDSKTLRQEVITKMRDFETMSWDEIKKRGSHDVAIHKLVKPAQKRLEELKQIDIEDLFSLRLTGKKRIWGIRDRTALRILWWDPDHKICPSLLD